VTTHFNNISFYKTFRLSIAHTVDVSGKFVFNHCRPKYCFSVFWL